ncbi:cytoplasmic polyadenylation element-binding protein 2 isoform X2 [Ranitomeya imitator]|uniref:cytoplasmic polyadenylation element-binding protein 2 isoform X2 n=1 Tax=Ranitomeya imitator TaxID=111125 RepID=UPI0037E921A7
MGDYGFGLLQTAGSGAGSGGGAGLFGGGAFRSSQQFGSPAGSALFLPGYPQVLQDELLLGVSCAPGKPGKGGGHQQLSSPPPALLLQHGAQDQQLGHKRKDFSPQESSAAFREELKKPGEAHHRQGSPKAEDLGVEGPDKLLPASPSSSSSSSSCSAEEAAAAAAAGDPHVPGSPPSLGAHQLAAKNKLQMDGQSGHLLSGGSNLLGSPFPGSPDLASSQSPGGSRASPSLAAFGTPWSVQTSSPPPAPPSQLPQQPPSAPHPAGHNLNALHSPEAADSFYPGIPSSINPAFFHSFSPVSASPCPGMNVPGFSSPFSAQISISQQQSRRSPVSPQVNPQHHQAAAFLQQRNNYNHHQPMVKQSPWSSHQGSGWSTGSMSWGGMHGRDRRTANMGMPGTMNQISPLKKPFSGNVIAPPKFTRSNPSLTPKSWIDDNVFRTDNNSNSLLPLQDRSRMYDSLNMHSLENSLIEIMRAEHDPLKGRLNYPHPGTDSLLMLNARSYGRRRGRSSLFPIDDGLLDDGHNDQVGVLNSPNCYTGHQNGERIERFSRKVFVGGLPPDIDEDEITASFRRFGPLVVDWPHKAESKSYFPPKGYAFLLFQEESSVQALIEACIEEDSKLYLCVSSPTIKDKPVQIRPWNLSDSDFVMDGSQPLDPRKTIFVGGVPRPLRAVELAMIMDRLYGGVCYAGIDTDPELKYPKGAGRVAFSNQQSYIAAISARFVQLQHGDIDKRVEVKPYVLDDQMCDECQGARCSGKFAPFFCANVTCLQYYCEFCWANIHSRAGREFHKPLVKEGADRPRQIHFRWN